MRRTTKGRTAIAYSEYLLEDISLAFRYIYMNFLIQGVYEAVGIWRIKKKRKKRVYYF
jgi:hypothetical protein